MDGDRRISSPFDATTGPPLAESRFIPQRYEPNYPYPLLVLLHGRSGDEHQMVASMPAMSWRNYIGLAIRGPEPVIRQGREAGYRWGQPFARPRRRGARPPAVEPPAEVLRRTFAGNSPDLIDRVEEGLFSAVRRVRKALHVHSERIFLVGSGEGAAVAYRVGLSFPERFAGVVAINGWIPGGFRPLARLHACRDLRVLVVHGQWNGRAPIENARREVALLRAGGLRVAFQSYPCAHRITSPMLADVDTWLMNQCTSDL